MNALRLAPALILVTLGITGCGAEYYEGGGQASYGQSGTAYNADGQIVADPPPATTTVIGADGTAQEVVVGAEDDEYVDTDATALTEFRTTLDPYGMWVDDGTYGTVWVPSETVVGTDFAPYVSSGHWSYADDYVWVSDYDWGWAPFHYGRWVYITGRGWAWIPGRTYAGAWVSWRVGPAGYGYVGWGPMAPTWYWRGGIAVGLAYYPPTPYTFCSTGDLFHPGIRGRVLAGPQVQTVATNTRPWVPASPGVGGGGGPGRAPATPQVGGPKVGPGGRIFGPSPGTLGLQPQAVVPPPPSEKGLLRAQAFARPSTAVQAGGRAPAGFTGAASRPTPVDYPRAPRDRTVVVQGGPQTYSGPRPVQAPPPAAVQSQGGYHPPPSYTPPPSQGQGQVYRSPPPSYSPPPSQGQGQVYRSPPPSYSPPPQVQQRSAPPPPPQVMQRSAPPPPPPQVHQAPPPAPRGGGAAVRRR